MNALPREQRYRVLRRLAAGGMAEVFLAESAGIEGFKKSVAIKRVLPHLSDQKAFIAMFLDEARLSARLNHSNVVQVFDIGAGEDTYFLVMEYVEGADLRSLLDQQQARGQVMPVELACFIALAMCQGLSYAHELHTPEGKPLSIVHRDVSPPNVLISRHGEVKIVDFGLAKASSQLEKSQAGVIKGKFSYLSPEAAQGLPVDHRADIFALGSMIWEMLSGRRLFLGESDFHTVQLVQEAEVPKLSSGASRIPAAVDRILAGALARDPRARYGSARELGRDLTRLLFELGRPVGAFDLESLVRAVPAAPPRPPLAKTSRIEGLIEEALFHFTSIQALERVSPASPPGPLSLDFVSLGSSEMGGEVLPSPVGPAPQLPQRLGNLAALEDEDPYSVAFARRSDRGPNPLGRAAPKAAGLPLTSAQDDADLGSARRRTLTWVLLLLLAVLGAAGWAWATLR